MSAPVELDKGGLRTILNLAAENAKVSGVRFAEKTSETWEKLARSATAPGPVTVALVGPPAFSGADTGERMIPVAEAAELMHVSQGHVRRLCRRGAIRSRRFGKRIWLVSETAAQDWKGSH